MLHVWACVHICECRCIVTYLECGVQRSTGVSVLIFQLVFGRVSCLWLCTPSETLMSSWEFSGSTPNLLAPPPIFWLHPHSSGSTSNLSSGVLGYRGHRHSLLYALQRFWESASHRSSPSYGERLYPTEPRFRCLSAVTEVDGYNRKLSFKRGRIWETGKLATMLVMVSEDLELKEQVKVDRVAHR